MLEVSSLSKRFQYREVLQDIHLDVEGGSIVTISGRNGSGKTTFLRILAGLAGFQAGQIRLAGYDLSTDPEMARLQTGFLSHSPQLYPDLTAAENLLYASRLYALKLSPGAIDGALAYVDLLPWRDVHTAHFSRGMLQRLALVRADLHRPGVLLLDEPASGMDEVGEAVVNRLIVAAAERGAAVVLTAHQPGVQDFVQRNYRLHQGRLTVAGEDGQGDGND